MLQTFNLTATAVSTNRIDLSWNSMPGATGYRVLSSRNAVGPFLQIGTTSSSTTTFSNTHLVGGLTYYYQITADGSCIESGTSNVASATAAACGCSSSTLYANGFESGSGLADWTVSGAGSTDWRGIQACSAENGTKIFRFGGTTCTNNYGNGRNALAQPSGASGIVVPAGANGTSLSFGHRREFDSYDGASLKLAVDGGAAIYVPVGAITSGASYNGTITNRYACPPNDPQCIPLNCNPGGTTNAPVWTGTQTSFVNTTVDLDAACSVATGQGAGCAGHAVHLYFSAITDCTGTAMDGWFLDDVNVNSCTGCSP
jgi:hypothetical protein